MFLGLGPNFRPNKIDAVIPAKAGIQLSDDSCNLAQDDDGRKHGQGLYFNTTKQKNWFDMDFGYCKSIGKKQIALTQCMSSQYLCT
jgi:hypothetical protein